jgi:hypothetical protein
VPSVAVLREDTVVIVNIDSFREFPVASWLGLFRCKILSNFTNVQRIRCFMSCDQELCTDFVELADKNLFSFRMFITFDVLRLVWTGSAFKVTKCRKLTVNVQKNSRSSYTAMHVPVDTR